MSARIAFFSERLPPDSDPIAGFSYELMRSLADQQYEVHVYSTYRPGDELPPPHPRIMVTRPFQHWSWLEVPRLLPLLMDFRPDILHVIEPRAIALKGLTNALTALPVLSPILGRPRLVTSFFNLRADDLKKHAGLLTASDAITTANRPQLRLLMDFLVARKRRPEVAIVPMALRATSAERIGESQQGDLTAEIVSEFLAKIESLILVPGDLDTHSDPRALFVALATVLTNHPQAGVLFAGGWAGVAPPLRHSLMGIFENQGFGGRVLITGPLNSEEMRRYLRHAYLVFAASLPGEALNLARLFRDALEAESPLMISEHQLEADPLQWRHRENVWLTSQNPSDWTKALSEALSEPEVLGDIRRRSTDFARLETIDHPGNAMSRLYSTLLTPRS
jgi:hypothetical protein